MRRIHKSLVGIILITYLVIQSWFLWPEYGHKILYKFTTSPQKLLRHDIVLHLDSLTAGIDKDGKLNYLSTGPWINTISGVYAPYISLKNPMAEQTPPFERIIYRQAQTFFAGKTMTAVSFSGYVKSYPYIHVITTYSVYDPTTIMIRSSISSSKKETFAWIGDMLKTNMHSMLFYVPGVGEIQTSPRDAISPQKPYVAILGRANQVVGFYYTGEQAPPYIFYEWNRIASVYPVRLDSNPFDLTRVLSSRSATDMDYRKVADSQYKNFLAVKNGLKITASSSNIITVWNKPVAYSVYVTNTGKTRKQITAALLLAPSGISPGKSYISTPVWLGPGQTHVFGFRVRALSGGVYYLYAAVMFNGNYLEGPWTRVFSNGPGWYSADMHNHDTYSVSLEVYPVKDMAEAARAKGIDVLSLTDYNSFSQSKECRGSSTADFLCIPGEEIANPFYGHANAQFIHKKVYEFLTPQHWIDNVHRQGGMFFINHPYLGIIQRWRDFNLKGYDGIEILNANKIPMDPVNVKAFDKWDELNRKGMHLYGIADSDAHTPFAVGTYRDYVYASSFTVHDVEKGFKKGMFYVTNGPMLSFTVNGNPMGSAVAIKKGRSIRIKASYLPNAQSPENAPVFQKMILFKDGYILMASDNPVVDYNYKPDNSGFYRIEIFTNNGGFAASNPVWVNVGK